MSKSNLTAEQRLQKAHLEVINNPHYCAIAGVIMLGKTEVVDSHPLADALGMKLTAGTDGRDTFYGRKFVEEMSDAELRAVIIHENYHKAFRHLTTWQHLFERNRQLANAAVDTVINLMILETERETGKGWAKLPPTPYQDPRFRNMDAGQVFRILEQEMMKAPKSKGGKGQGSGDEKQEGGGGFDMHDFEGAQGMSTEEQQQLAQQIDQALRQGAILAGKQQGNVDRGLLELLEPKINWKEELREFVQQIIKAHDYSTWRRPNRRFIAQDIYMPSTQGESVGPIVVGIDTSGSIGDEELRDFVSEVVGICKTVTPELVHLLYWDTAVAGHEKYGPGEYDGLATSTKPKGGGGTAPVCVPLYLTKHKIKAECVIMLTDGYTGGDWGQGQWDGTPVLWVIAGGNKDVATTGKTLRLE